MHESSSKVDPNAEVTSPLKKNAGQNNKKKGVPLKQVYRKIDLPLLTDSTASGNELIPYVESQEKEQVPVSDEADGNHERDPKKKRPTPTNSNNPAEAAARPCPAQ